MKKLLWISIAAAILTAFAVSSAFAQYDEDKAQRLTLKIGIYRPAGTTLREEGKSLWRSFGVTYDLTQDTMGRAKSYAGIESASAEDGRFKGSVTSLQYGRLFRPAKTSARGPYYGGAVGMYMGREEQAWTELDFGVIGPPEKESGTKFGFSAVGGYSFNEHWIAEIRYTKMGEVAPGVDFSGITAYVGGRVVF